MVRWRGLLGRLRHALSIAERPPLTSIVAPEIHFALGLTRKPTASAMSAGWRMLTGSTVPSPAFFSYSAAGMLFS